MSTSDFQSLDTKLEEIDFQQFHVPLENLWKMVGKIKIFPIISGRTR